MAWIYAIANLYLLGFFSWPTLFIFTIVDYLAHCLLANTAYSPAWLTRQHRDFVLLFCETRVG